MKLFSYWRSTTSIRVRIALNLKGCAYDIAPIDLTKGEQRTDDYSAINPIRGVPTLVLDDGRALTQSMAILDYLDTAYPEPPLYPADPVTRAHVDAAAHAIALDIHPVNNLRVLGYLKGQMGQSQEQTVKWMNHWMHEGFTAFQKQINPDTPYCFGDQIGIADLCLVGQMVNARRWGLDLAPFGRLVEIDTQCQQLDAVQKAMPENQPDAQPV